MLKVKIPEHFQGDLWARLPKPKERLQGLSRTTLLEIILRGLIHSVVIRWTFISATRTSSLNP